MAELRGRRLPDGEHYHDSEPGDYWKIPARKPDRPDEWAMRDPQGYLGSLRKHTVTEHEDGTITVSPSILDERPGCGTYHGFLERGVWRDA